ncbi:tRNA-splicing endonuclease subunit SEN54 [Actinacidiphila cocklensis]|uniref:tRNA-splicing endonuclease subunit SEN54 n=1 Tax=Actinacidiphila cocklensis TaxID=887465 RepID=A0A9W4EBR3_9ACTN|nr:tRNA-splicing endonuclease subunit SEN54 [Actinacidiphila cocklensis]
MPGGVRAPGGRRRGRAGRRVQRRGPGAGRRRVARGRGGYRRLCGTGRLRGGRAGRGRRMR